MPSLEKVALMIVEDDPHIRYLMEAAALRAGVFGPIATAPDGQAAFEALRGWTTAELPEFIVTDLSMPRMTGLELVRALKADSRLQSIPVAVITSSDLPNDRAMTIEAGACAFIEKPQGLDALTKALLELRASCVTGVPLARGALSCARAS